MNSNLDKLISQHRLKLHFFFFLKKIKQSITHKIFLINIYFFIRNNSFEHFITIARLKAKKTKLRFKLKQIRVKRFFNKTKEIINSIKNPNGKITSVHAYLFYFHSLKQRIFQGLKWNIKQNKICNRNKLSLYSIRFKMAMTVFLMHIKKFHNVKDLPDKEAKFNHHNILKTLKTYSKTQIETNDKFRLMRRFVYINTVKYTLKHITNKGLSLIIKENKIDNISKSFLLKIGIRILKQNSCIISQIKRRKEMKYSLAKKHFIKRIKYHVINKHLVLKNIQIMIKKISSISNRNTFGFLNDLCDKEICTENRLKEQVITTIVLKRIKEFVNNRIDIINKRNILQRKLRVKGLQYMNIIINKSKAKKEFDNQKQLKTQFIINQLQRKVLDNFKSLHNVHQHIQKQLFISSNYYSSKIAKLLFWRLVLYKDIQLEKKKHYNKIQKLRNEIISKKLLQHLIITYSQQINIKEDLISSQLINKRSRGLRTAFMWFSRLKALVLYRKKHEITNKYAINSYDQTKIENTLKPNTLSEPKIINNSKTKNMKIEENLIEDMKQLTMLRNKKRMKPVKLLI